MAASLAKSSETHITLMTSPRSVLLARTPGGLCVCFATVIYAFHMVYLKYNNQNDTRGRVYE